MRKERCDSQLGRLSDKRQDLVWRWVRAHGYVEAARLIGLAPPEGLGLKTHVTSVRRFFVRYQERKDRMPLSPAEALEFDSDTAPLNPVTTNAVRYAAYELATGPVNLKTFKEVSNWILARQNIELREKQLELSNEQLRLARERFEFERETAELDAARLALDHFAELQLIYNAPGFGGEEKVRAARRRQVGTPFFTD